MARVLSVTSLGVLLTLANTSVIDVALPAIRAEFGASALGVDAVLLSYMIVNVVLLLAFGRISDIYGRKRVFILGLAGFAAASLACALAPTVWALAAFRGVLGVAAAAVLANTTALILDSLPPDRVSVALGYNVLTASLAQVAGPLVGGALVSLGGWRVVFIVNIPLALGAAALGFFALPGRNPGPAESFDGWSALYSLIALTGMIGGITASGFQANGQGLLFGGLAVCFVFGVLFVRRQARIAHPLLDLALLGDAERNLAYVTGFIVSGVRFSVVLVVSLLCQTHFGLSPLEAAKRVVVIASGLAVSAPLSGHIMRKTGLSAHLPTIGLGLVVLGLGGLRLQLSHGDAGSSVIVPLFVLGVGIGLFATPNTASILRGVPASQRGVANGLRTMSQNCGSTVFVALSLALIGVALPAQDKVALYITGAAAKALNADAFLMRGFGYAVDFLMLAALGGLAFSGLRLIVRKATSRASESVPNP
ncbi:MFS transporter [Acetobacteraceae bacterium KSS8]|uniref:MFS transporter n=1 Tax=Endosaccharibacter trunci TaxID=2812733 RepID=A0ABT1W7R0_9PROT|nr:MFS transporter [Acetobacteraceae bacterium KSS8]